MPLIEVDNIHKTYQRGDVDVPVLKGISLEIEEGEFVALMGASGSGKTTLMNLLGGLDRPTSGTYCFDQRDMSRLSRSRLAAERNQHIGFVFQGFNLMPRATAFENTMMPTIYSARRNSARRWRQRCGELLKIVGLAERMDHAPAQMSGGEQQRVAIARSLVNEPRLLLADEPTGNLDSKTGREILDLFGQLNQEHGITILLVTHDEAVARTANRVIRIADGRILSDERSKKRQAGPKDGVALDTRVISAGQKRRRFFWSPRSLRGSVGTALSAMRRNVMRTVLTMLGVIIGVAAVVAVMEVSQGASEAITNTVENMGANTISVRPGESHRAGISLGGGSAATLTPDDALAIERECPAVVNSAPIVWTRVHLIHGNRNWKPNDIYGTTPNFLAVRNWNDVRLGRSFTSREVRNASKVCLLGQTVVDELFPRDNPIGKEIRVKNVPMQVIGVLSAKGANLLGTDQDDVMVAPWTTIKYRVDAGSDEVELVRDRHSGPKTQRSVRFANLTQVLVQATSSNDVSEATTQIKTLLRRRHGLVSAEDDFRIRALDEISSALNRIVRLLSALVLLVAGFALLVGGVGIMNIMLVSVTERTREIGLRMAVGANGRDILRQFLIEAVVLCVAGGLIGIAVGHGLTIVVGEFMNWPAPTSLVAAAIALAVSAGVGIAFGYYPAWKASRLDPIEALRYE